MTIQEIADRLVALCREGKYEEAQQELYAENAVSEEPVDSNIPKVEGLAAIIQKGKQFEDMVEEFYGGDVSDPIIADDYFSVMMSLDVKYKGQERSKDAEIAVFEVSDGKIVSEQFFYKGSI